MIDLLDVCVWQGNTYDTISTDNPSWEDVVEAISQLNNRERNDLYLQPDSEDPEYFLGVCGGDGKYFASGMDLKERARTWPSSKNVGTRLVKLIAGGQLSEFEERFILNQEEALVAVRSFYDHGGFDDSGNWQ